MTPVDVRVVFCTCPSGQVAGDLASTLVNERLAACVNLVPGVRSIYVWQGVLCDDVETLLVMKTTAAAFDALRERIAELHPYETPEIIALPVNEGHAPYLEWVLANTRE